jgi:3-methyladenine DNA glycosylase AlkC
VSGRSDRSARINRGEIETKNLAECLKVDFGILFGVLRPEASELLRAQVDGLGELGILKRMERMGELLLGLGKGSIPRELITHRSDTVRGWAAFGIGQDPKLTLRQRLEQIQVLADDPHFGVREWAWMAVRRHLDQDLGQAIQLLARWTAHESPRIRRFASEATRPRGVWAAHIEALKEAPKLALAILEPLKADPDRYVQDSVANWLNDASKTQPHWVQEICGKWSKQSSGKSTSYIVGRAMRSIKKSR